MERNVSIDTDEDGNVVPVPVTEYKIIKPILRIDPQVFLSRSNTLEKLIVNKMLNACLEDPVALPRYDLPARIVILRSARLPVKVEIDECPFLIHQSDTPSISTTNQQLLQVAINHIDELIQCE